jgi:low affinity Fe/Cu permease
MGVTAFTRRALAGGRAAGAIGLCGEVPMARPEAFVRFARAVSEAVGKSRVFAAAATVVAIWLLLGPFYRFSDTWQLTMETITGVVTFLMVFVIQNTQNRQATATQVKLDELIRAVQGAHTRLVALEDVSDEEMKAIRESYRRLATETRRAVELGREDTGAPSIEDGLEACEIEEEGEAGRGPAGRDAATP